MSRTPLYPPLVTPFSNDDVDTEALAGLVEAVESRGVDGVVPCGTTGEFASLTDAEYREVVTTTADASERTVIAGVSDTNIAGVRAKMDVAADAGCDAALLTGPYFHRENATGGTEQFLRAAVSDAPLPVYLYNIPVYVGAALSPETVGALASEDALCGVKDSSGDLDYLQRVVRETPQDFEVLCGFDSVLLPALSCGATGGINALANAVPEVLRAAVDAADAGENETARTLSRDAIEPLFEQCAEHGFAPATKVAAHARGFLDETAVRPPLVNLSADERDDVAAAVDDALAALERV